MTSPYRAMCEQLMELVEGKRYDGSAVVARARALLAQPEPEGPTDAALIKMWATASYIDQPEGGLAFARAVLARYGGSTSNPTEA